MTFRWIKTPVTGIINRYFTIRFIRRKLSDGEVPLKPELPSPELCCMTGCPNCIFITYADDLIDYCRAVGKDPKEEVKLVTTDPNIRVMIEMLLREVQSKKE